MFRRSKCLQKASETRSLEALREKKGPAGVPSMIALPWAVRPHCEVVTHTTACGGNQALGQQPWEFWFNGYHFNSAR